MSAQSRRAVRCEERAARALGTKRVLRRKGESAPDLETVRLKTGLVLQPEVKSRLRLPELVEGSLEQARRYAPGCIPLGVISARAGRQVAVLYLEDLARLLGLKTEPPGQVVLPFSTSAGGTRRG